ncbi:MAG: quinone oxidoreductase [Alphaproteobacteria bacterium]
MTHAESNIAASNIAAPNIAAYGIHQPGDADQLQPIQMPELVPAAGEVVIKQNAIGLNFIDIYQRSGLYPVSLPSVLGMEGAGVVEQLGDGVTSLKVGDRAAYAGVLGGYAAYRTIQADRLVKLPESVDDQTAAASMLRGMTAEYLIHRSFKVQAGDFVLFHAAAGGVGQIAVQWLKLLGAKVIGVVSTKEKADIVTNLGCDHVIIGRDADIAGQVMEFTKGKKVKVSYDSVGASSYEASLNSLCPLGMLVSYGNASGPITQMSPKDFASRGSLFFTRPSLMDYIKSRDDLELSAGRWFDALQKGVKVNIGQTHALSDVAKAHKLLESGATTGASLLLP